MKFFAILFLLCGIVGFALASSSATPSSNYNDYGSDTVTSTEEPTTSAPPAQAPCGSGPNGPCGLPPCVGGTRGDCGKKIYFFF